MKFACLQRKINGGNGSTANQAPASPTQSVASFSSNGSGGGNNGSNHNAPSSDCSSQGGANNLTSGSGANVQMSSDMYTIFENYIDSSQHLIAAHDTWDQAALLLKRPNVASKLLRLYLHYNSLNSQSFFLLCHIALC